MEWREESKRTVTLFHTCDIHIRKKKQEILLTNGKTKKHQVCHLIELVFPGIFVFSFICPQVSYTCERGLTDKRPKFILTIYLNFN